MDKDERVKLIATMAATIAAGRLAAIPEGARVRPDLSMVVKLAVSAAQQIFDQVASGLK